MEVIPMGKTQLPLEVILEYLESLKAIYTMEVRHWNMAFDVNGCSSRAVLRFISPQLQQFHQ